MAYQRPVNLNLFTIKFPIPAIISILHRTSGAILFLLLPLILWLLNTSLSSPENFDYIQTIFTNWFFKIVVWGLLAALIFHLFAGIRHLIMDLGIGESLKAARGSAWLVIGLSVLIFLAAVIWLW